MQLFITKGCIFSFVNLIVGLSVGPNAALASLIGQKKRDKIPEMLHTILAFGVLLGVGLVVLGLLLARVILEVSGTPESVMGKALVYIRIYLLSIPFMSVYNFGAAILRSYGDTLSIVFMIWDDFFVSIYTISPAVFTILGTVVFRLIWLFTVFKWSPTYSMLMNVYVASWVFTGVSIFIIYIRHMKKVEQGRV